MHRWLFLVALLVVGCSTDGRALADPEDWQTTTTRPLPPTSALPNEDGADGLTLRSPDFEPGGEAPVGATCADANVFPSLEWSELPAGAAELAVALSDQTDPDEPLLLWLMAGIAPSVAALEAGLAPAGAFETLNDYGNLGYGTPCLENLGAGRRDLQFRLYVLDQPSGLAPGDPGNEAWDTVAARSVDTASVLMRIDATG
ncbi:MAG: YbhB/YbcL family Raf kinase inhibitor-like protein [Acidimicrobiales bacterium]